MNSESIQVLVWRGDADGGALTHYAVPRQASQTVLDVVTWIPPLHIAGRLEIDDWGGRRKAKLRVEDAAPVG